MICLPQPRGQRPSNMRQFTSWQIALVVMLAPRPTFGKAIRDLSRQFQCLYRGHEDDVVLMTQDSNVTKPWNA